MANDFHFTIHVGLLVVYLFEFWTIQHNITALVTLFVIVGQSFLTLVLRGSYVIDLIAAVIFGYFFWLLGMWLSYWVDVKILGIPF